jgi:membrane protein implicated in regulation of membrane protease activity
MLMMDINSPFTMIVLIVLISVSAGVIRTWIKSRRTDTDDPRRQEEIAQLRDQVAGLTERVRVLETITTDADAKLREDISRLR